MVAGIRTPQNLTEAARVSAHSDKPSMEAAMPKVFREFAAAAEKLERHYRDMQDMEFTVERGKLYMLQTRGGKRTAKAALRIAVEMANEGLITRDEAVARVEPAALDQLLHPTIDPNAPRTIIATGLPASPGAASGEIVFSADEAEALKAAGRKVILVRVETTPEDIHGMHAAEGILTTRGGMTSHAAVVARGMGKPCVSGAGSLRVDYAAKTMSAGAHALKAGDIITVDGSSGQVLLGRVAMVQPELSGEFATIMEWADGVRRLGVRANADTPADARLARNFGAEGIGLCRTEHMFFDADRILAVREMILADDEAGRRKALAKLLPMQRADFVEHLRDHEGPAGDDPAARSAAARVPAAHAGGDRRGRQEHGRRSEEARAARSRARRNSTRCSASAAAGSPSPIPEIAEMQARAIFEAAVAAAKSTGTPVVPEIMVPLIATKAEFDLVKARIDAMAQAVAAETGTKIAYQIGTMIELPRACLRAAEIARDRRVLLVRHQRSHANRLRHLARRRGELSPGLHGQGHPAGRSVRFDRPRRRRRADQDRRRARAERAARSQGRHLRRARRRPGLGRLLRGSGPRLRVVLAVPRADRAAGRRPGGSRQGQREHRLNLQPLRRRLFRESAGSRRAA